jgi:hypothetical protein
MPMEYVYAFAAGFLSTLTFHQGTLFVLHKAGLWPKPPWPMTPTEPLKIPAVISLALWGGLWGIALWYVVMGQHMQYWICATLFGAIFPSLVALFVVFPLKGLPMAGGWSPKVIGAVLLLNGAWGFGVAVLMRVVASL